MKLETNFVNPPKPANRILRLRGAVRIVFTILALFFLPLGCKLAGHYTGASERAPWWELRRDSSEQAPLAAEYEPAVIQVYAARAARWRGNFGVHTWIAVKPQGADRYQRIEVNGFAKRWGGNIVRVWPGPNSNTFIAWLARETPELQLDLPPTAIGKDYRPLTKPLALAPSGLGVQLSVRGLAGLMLSVEEGIELNLAGLTVGLDFYPPAIKLPGIGRVGFADSKRFNLSPR